MQPDPLHIQQVTGTNVVIGHGARQIINIDGRAVALPSFDELTAHLRAVAAHPSFARWADRSEPGDPPLRDQPPIALNPPIAPDIFIEARAQPLPQRLSPWRPLTGGGESPAQDLLQALANVNRAVILGEPGSGKTSALERLAWTTATASLANATSGVLEIPVFAALSLYGGEADLIPALRRSLNRHGVLELDDHSLRSLLRVRNLRFTLLLDGLNELGRHAATGAAAIVCHLSDYPGHTVYLTCRTADFDATTQTPPGAQLWEVQELEDNIRYWGDPQGHSDVRDYLRQHLGEVAGKRLYERIRAEPRLHSAARAPLLLWMLKEAGASGDLPGNRGELVRTFVKSERALGRIPKPLRHHAERSLEAIGWRLRELGRQFMDGAILDVELGAVRRAHSYGLDDMIDWLQATGLLVLEEKEGRRDYKLMHELVQEYGAAAHLTRQPDCSTRLLELAREEWWRETCILALWMHEGMHSPAYLQQVMTTPAVDLRVRVAAAGILAQVGDPRFVPAVVGGVKVILPDMVPIPGGRAALGGEDPDGYSAELPECEVEVIPFDLARYPVTNAEYRCFMVAGGYEDESLWTEGGRAWLKGEGKLDAETEEQLRSYHRFLHEDVEGAIAALKEAGQDVSEELADTYRQISTLPEDEYIALYAQQVLGEQRRQPVWWDDTRFNQPSQPVVGVNWYEAMAYAAWLGRVTGEPYALPTEAQWEWAARRRSPGEPGRRYPWGDDWDAWRCNHSGSRLLAPSPVGVYPHGVTPDGLHDLAGNVYEWTASLYRPYPYDPIDGREDVEADGTRSVRGGSWYVGAVQARCAYRNWYLARFRFSLQGFRVARILST